MAGLVADGKEPDGAVAEDAEDTIEPGISKDLLAYMKMQDRIRQDEIKRQDKIRAQERQEKLEKRAYLENLRKQRP